MKGLVSSVLAGVGAFVAAGALSGSVSYGLQHASAEREALRAAVDSLRLEVHHGRGRTGPNVITDFSPDTASPVLGEGSHVDRFGSILGRVEVGAGVYVAPFASIRADEGQPIYLGDFANVQDGVVIHALETESHGVAIPNRTYAVKGRSYAVYVGNRVSLAHQALVHGPARIDDDVFVGMQAMVFTAHIGAGTVVEPGAIVMGVTVPPGRIVPAGAAITTQAAADTLPHLTAAYPLHGINDAVVHVNRSFAKEYGSARAATRDDAGHEAAGQDTEAKAHAPAKASTGH